MESVALFGLPVVLLLKRFRPSKAKAYQVPVEQVWDKQDQAKNLN
jgi:hypothetical protein